jgi:DNA-binding transcriptional LysR family regulator
VILLQRDQRGHLRLVANQSALTGFLPGVLAAYAVRHPNVRIDLEDCLSEDAVRAIQKGSAELGRTIASLARPRSGSGSPWTKSS